MHFMAKSIIAHPAQESTTEKLPDYVLRGLGIFELHRDDILASYQGGGHWIVPSGSVAGKHYEVRTGTRAERNKCECIGFEHHRHCSHLVAAHRAAKLSAVCDSCGERVWMRGLIEVTDDHESLTWFPGDLLCIAECAGNHGVL